MLNVFPDFLTFGLLAPFLLRLAVGFLFLKAGVKKAKGGAWTTPIFEKMHLRPGARYTLALGVIEVVSGILLIIGLYTQVAALAAALISLFGWYAKKKHPSETPGSKGAFLLLFVISLSLLFSGAGFFAFDLPL